MKKKIAIIGAGISGLTFANLLKDDINFDFTVYEKNESFHLNEGYGVQLATNSVYILNKIGFNNFNANEKFNPEKIDFYSYVNNKKICDLNLNAFNFENAQYTTLMRSKLIKYLKENLLMNAIQFNKKLKEVKYENSKIQIIFEDKSSDVIDYLVIADGIFSSAKSIINNKNYSQNYLGSLAIRKVLKNTDIKFLHQDNVSILLGPNLHLVLYPLNKSYDFNLVAILKKKLDQDTLKEKNFFKNIKNILQDSLILKNNLFKDIFSFNENTKCFPIFCDKKIKKNNQKNTFFIGDAFFSYPPTFAQGASSSIESAYELFKILQNENTINLKKYNKIMIKKVKMVSKRSYLNYFIFHLSNPIICKIRNIILKILVNNKFFLNYYLGKIYLKK